MENYSYPASYPESGDSSPRSREIDFDNTGPWEEQPAGNNYKVKFMCSYGGKINPRPHDNQLSYIGGETKILAVDRSIKFAGLVGKLAALCDADVCFKYQLPGEDLDALISVTNDDDLEHMMHEYDRLYRASPKPARMRLFLFPAAGGSFGSSEGKSDRERFVDALNSGPVQPSQPPLTAPPPPQPQNSVDFLFGLEKGIPPPLPPQVLAKVQDPTPDPGIQVQPIEDRVAGPDLSQSQIQELHAMYRKRSEDNLVGAFSGDYYAPKIPEKLPPLATTPATVPATVASPQGYWPENHAAAGFYPPTTQQQVYMIPTPTNMYHAPMGRQMTGPAGQGYYAVQRMPTDVYRDQPSMYSVPPPAPVATAVAPPTLPPPKVAGFSEGIGMVRPTTAGGVGMVDTGYTQMAYDNGPGRQVYYAAQGGVVVPPQYQAMAAAVSADMRPSAGALNQEGKVVVKAPQAAV